MEVLIEWLRLKVGRGGRLPMFRRFGAYQRGSRLREKMRETDAETYADEKLPKLPKPLQRQKSTGYKGKGRSKFKILAKIR